MKIRAADPLTHARLLEVLDYDRDSGIFRWKQSRGRLAKAGYIAGSVKSDGYIRIAIDGVRYYANRLAWFYVTGTWPESIVDHENGVHDDNAFDNLRDVTHSVNLQNQRSARADNKTTGLLGCHFHKRVGKFAAQIKPAGDRIKHLGYFDTAELAHDAYLSAKRRLHEGCTI